jgi:DNA-binding Xre family transcriptional regulator
MIRFKVKAVEQRLEGRKSELMPSNYQNIKRTIEKGAEDINPNALSQLCRDLECLPTDIVEFV